MSVLGQWTRGVQWECRKPVEEHVSVGGGKPRDRGQAGLTGRRRDPGERLERGRTDPDVNDVGNRTDAAGGHTWFSGLEFRREPWKTCLTLFTDAFRGTPASRLSFVPVVPSCWPCEEWTAATSLLLRDPRGSRGRERRLVCRNWAHIPGSAPHSSALVISCLVPGIFHHAATTTQLRWLRNVGVAWLAVSATGSLVRL